MEAQFQRLSGAMQTKGVIVGSLVDVVSLSGTVCPKATIAASVIAPTLINLPAYKGPYVIYPEVTKQDFSTRDTRMTEDLQVTAIPYHEVSNESGQTVIIGGRINGI